MPFKVGQSQTQGVSYAVHSNRRIYILFLSNLNLALGLESQPGLFLKGMINVSGSKPMSSGMSPCCKAISFCWAFITDIAG